MCVVSMIYDHYHDEWDRRLRPYRDYPTWPPQPAPRPANDEERDRQLQKLLSPKPPAITPAEIDEFRRLLDRAREYDQKHHEPDCELEPKKQALKNLARELDVEISFL